MTAVDTIAAEAWVPDAALAWSACEVPDIVEHVPAGPSWSRALARVAAGALAVGSGVAAAAVLLLAPAAVQPGGAVDVAAPAAATDDVAGPVAPPVLAESPPIMAETVDGEYLTSLRRSGIDYRSVGTSAVMVANAHRTCHNFAVTGWPMERVVAKTAPELWQFSLAQVGVIVAAGVRAYCPQYTS